MVPIKITATASDDLSGVKNVELYYRSSIDNEHWTDWKLYGIDIESADNWSWVFDAPDGYVLYEFYSIATDGAGNVEKTPAVADASCGVVIPATADIDPDTLNLESRGKWITAYIELPTGYDVASISIPSIKLEGAVRAESDPKYGFVRDPDFRDRDGDGLPEFMVKFDRAVVQALLEPGEGVKLVITGKWHAVLFKGADTIRVISPGQDNNKRSGSR